MSMRKQAGGKDMAVFLIDRDSGLQFGAGNLTPLYPINVLRATTARE